jgi:hypothetical protein
MSKSSRNVEPDVDLHYVDTLLKLIKEYVNTRFNHVDDAVRLANDAMQVRLEHLNGMYQQIQRMGDKYPNKSDLDNLAQRYELQVKSYDEDIRYLRESKAEIAGKASLDSVNKVQENVSKSQTLVVIGLALSLISLGCGGIGMLVAVISLIIRFFGM